VSRHTFRYQIPVCGLLTGVLTDGSESDALPHSLEFMVGSGLDFDSLKGHWSYLQEKRSVSSRQVKSSDFPRNCVLKSKRK